MCFRYSQLAKIKDEVVKPYKNKIRSKKLYKSFRFSHKPESHFFFDVRQDGKRQFFPLLIL